MALTESKRIEHIVATSAEIAADDFDGRFGFDTTEQAMRIRVGGTAKYASMRGHTHTGSEVSGVVLTTTDQTISGTKTFDTVIASAIQAKNTTIGTDYLELKSESGTTIAQVRSTDLDVLELYVNGSRAIKSDGRLEGSAIRVSNFAQSANVPVAVGVFGDFTPITSVVREAILQPLPITNNAPTVVNVVDANMKSFGFDGATQMNELFYHIDVQHDYIAGTDMIFHVHWMPATTAGGNVKFQCYYQWVESGGTFPAATLIAPSAVAAGATAWADKRTDFTISGSGRTYNSRLMLRLFRDPTDAADTYGGNAVLSSVGCHYSANPVQ